ncbi:Manganese-dependent ADP-ribose/CDP-alcohol diphosphatase [Hibiscus syriacus]|uniref:Manganese-dependent ADP-ribose/CDP-alcohol diphosphatase n=1 Tax=Hibiscus syriacus TaxID=106335 RepID=A0A6A2XTR6_HIBSY|nr:Manganese-dependent ADP-ribose/CDP-alcohol diphosphatase [Hibiscus syriacus]
MALANGLANVQGRHPIFSFGVIADVQYADVPDGHSFLDIVDGKCPKDQSVDAVKRVVGEFEKFRGPVSRIMSVVTHAYYDFSPTPVYRFFVLDGYDISAIGWPHDHPNTLEALKILSEKSPNSNKTSPEGLKDVDRRFVMFNGEVGIEQMEWLDSVLQDATNTKQKEIVCCHLPLDPGATGKTLLLWNYDQVLDVIHRYDCVKVCLTGHSHKGRYSIDSHGFYHKVLDAALECPPGSDAFGYIDVYDNMLSLVGTDRLENTDFSFGSLTNFR